MTMARTSRALNPFDLPHPVTTFPSHPLAPAAVDADVFGDPDFPGILVWD